MAMSFAVTGLKAPGIVIANPECTGKTYPRFFEDLAALVGHR
jgi:3-phosphoshikimate 1-carboxyvinyltransferase